MLAFLKSRWFLLLLAAVLLVGLAASEPLRPLAESRVLQNMILAGVMFLMALPLEFSAMLRALKKPGPVLLASAVNLLIIPLAAWAASPLLIEPLRLGLLVAAATPCTLASAAVWTRRAGGADSVAILVTLLTNGTCFLTMPLWLAAMTGTIVEDHTRLLAMISELALLVVLPLLLAQLARRHKPLGRWATENKIPLGVAAQLGILLMVLIGCIKAGLEIRAFPTETAPRWPDYLLMGAAVVALHLGGLALGYQLAARLGMQRGDSIAVAFAGSQKTLMVGVHMAAVHFGGLAILPILIYHITQLLIDTLIADRFRRTAAADPLTPAADAK